MKRTSTVLLTEVRPDHVYYLQKTVCWHGSCLKLVCLNKKYMMVSTHFNILQQKKLKQTTHTHIIIVSKLSLVLPPCGAMRLYSCHIGITMDAIPNLPCRGSSLPQGSLTKTLKLKLAFLSYSRCPVYCITNSEIITVLAENMFKVILTWYHCRNFGNFLRFGHYRVLKQVRRRGTAATEPTEHPFI